MFEATISNLDTGLYRTISSQTTEADRKSLLALQNAVRTLAGEYVYLEIGSYLGGSIQPHLLDSRCRRIYSIDKRCRTTPDERDEAVEYEDNSAERMLELLSRVDPEQVSKIVCLDGDTRGINASSVTEAPHLCLIDGEHTPVSVLSDFLFCLSVSTATAVIALHDCILVQSGIRMILAELRKRRIRFRSARLAGSVFAIALRGSPILNYPLVKGLSGSAALFFFMLSLGGAYSRYVPASLRLFLKPVVSPFHRYLFRG